MYQDEDINEIQRQMDSWNPMQEDYTNSQFNKYSTGPGAYLDPALQPAQQAKETRQQPKKDNQSSKEKYVPYLVLKHLPQGTTKKAITNICSRYGVVTDVRDSTKNDYFFVDFPTIAEMESVYRALVKNNYGFHVLVGKQKSKQQTEPIVSDVENNLPLIKVDKDGIDLENRTYRTSEKHLPRPHFERKPMVSLKSYEAKNSLLQRNDPHRHYLINEDAHELERSGLKEGMPQSMENSKYKYRTGRAYIEMPEKSKNFVEEKSRQSLGSYDTARRVYENNHEGRKIGRPVNVGQCTYCQRICDIVCARCQTYFCGLECQRTAWPKHRQICGKENQCRINNLKSTNFPKSNSNAESESNRVQSSANTSASSEANLLPKNDQKQSESRSAEIPRSGSLITLTSISKTNIVFIRSKADEENYNFFKLINEVQSDAKNMKKLSKLPSCGQIVIVDFEGQFNRAMVLNSDDEQRVKLIYIDYGNLDARKFEELYEAPRQFVDIQRFAVPVILKDVPEMYMTEEIRKFMYSYLNCIDLVIKYETETDCLADKGVYKVELIDGTTNQNFNKMVAKICKPTEPLNPDEAYFANYLPRKQLPEGENIELVVMDNSLLQTGCISCTTKEWAIEIEKFQADLQTYAESLKEQCYTPRVSELCIAKYKVDDKWYRGRCLEIVGDGYPSIVFIDYGNIEKINVKDIRRYPAQFTFPIYTCDCGIEGLPEPECGADLVQKLEEVIPNGSTILCNNVEIYKEDNFHVVTLTKLIQKLKLEGLLKEG
ncbi:PREDICTED: protein vreteno isoform X1 [Rhagoletis zephyria]|uniref:protein vreteno isoform X1 n=1 Tax=Rhagoletis zephyria TaxID=28612 RepID=UPI00081170B5|nr:PREDICTED: protein vreteno isoform X1 [Rhagoletis zephyria]